MGVQTWPLVTWQRGIRQVPDNDWPGTKIGHRDTSLDDYRSGLHAEFAEGYARRIESDRIMYERARLEMVPRRSLAVKFLFLAIFFLMPFATPAAVAAFRLSPWWMVISVVPMAMMCRLLFFPDLHARPGIWRTIRYVLAIWIAPILCAGAVHAAIYFGVRMLM